MTTGAGQHETMGRDAFEFPIGDELRGERATLGRSLLDVQRDLRIKAAYIAAIENADVSVFPNPSFISGYVRSYARYLGRDPDEVLARFRAQSGFAADPPGFERGLATKESGRKSVAGNAAKASGVFRPNFPMAEPVRGGFAGLPSVPLPAIGSLLVLFGLIGVLGYGGWTVLQNIQRVQFAPVEELPVAMVEIGPPATPDTVAASESEFAELAQPVAAMALADLYRQQELEVPILVPRDGPIAAINPDVAGVPVASARGDRGSAGADPFGPPAAASELTATPASVSDAHGPQLAAAITTQTVTIIAERAAWIRVYLSDKTVIFERILETGETYSPPPDAAGPMVWAGNSGSVYVRVGDVLRGPIGSGTRSVRDVPLTAEAVVERFPVVEQVPDVIAQALDADIAAAAIAMQ